MNRILIINPFGIGDVLFSTPLLKNIKKHNPGIFITYVCNRRTHGILKNSPNISKLYIVEKDEYRKLWNESRLKCLKSIHGLLREIKKDRYDLCIDMSMGYLSSLLLGVFARIPVRVGFNYRDRGKFLTRKLTISGFHDKHVIEHYLDLGRMAGFKITDNAMELGLSGEDCAWAGKFLNEAGIGPSDKICAIIPGCGESWGGSAKYRQWSTWKFAEVADKIAEIYGYKIVIIGSEKELPICQKVLSEMKTKPIQAAGKTTLSQAAALLSKCDLVISNDGGPLHMAVALNRKTVSIFGPVNHFVYGPYPADGRHIAIVSDDTCRPCYRNFKHKDCMSLECLKNIKPDRVFDAAKRLIEATAR